MKILVINGPNINMVGIREPDIYGKQDFQALQQSISQWAEELGVEVEMYQSNHEGDLVDVIQKAYFDHTDGIVINPAAYTHTSVAILNALKAVSIPTVEVHPSDIYSRDKFRQFSYTSMAAEKTIAGEGFDGYRHAMEYLIEQYG